MSGETRWEVTYVRVKWFQSDALDEVNRLGAEGWEPFAGSDSTTNGMTIFLRRAARGEAGKDKGE